MTIRTFDDGDEIIFTTTVNIYENKLIIDEIADFKFIFLFKEDNENKGTDIKINGDPKKKVANIELINFNNTLGSATTRKIKVIETDKGKNIYFSIFAKALSRDVPFLQVTTTFYSN